MQVDRSPAYPFPFFFVGGRVVGLAPVTPIGVLVVRQSIPVGGAAVTAQQVLIADVSYQHAMTPPPATDLALQFETDLVPVKPLVDVVVIRSIPDSGPFGTCRIKRGAVWGQTYMLDFGWRDRTTAPRLAESGNVAAFASSAVTDPANPPTLVQRLALPNGFQESFYNGGRVTGESPLSRGDIVEFTATGAANGQSVTIPKAPSIAITGAANAPVATVYADTVVYNINTSQFFVTWRGVFPWSAALEAPTARLSVA